MSNQLKASIIALCIIFAFVGFVVYKIFGYNDRLYTKQRLYDLNVDDTIYIKECNTCDIKCGLVIKNDVNNKVITIIKMNTYNYSFQNSEISFYQYSDLLKY